MDTSGWPAPNASCRSSQRQPSSLLLRRRDSRRRKFPPPSLHLSSPAIHISSHPRCIPAFPSPPPLSFSPAAITTLILPTLSLQPTPSTQPHPRFQPFARTRAPGPAETGSRGQPSVGSSDCGTRARPHAAPLTPAQAAGGPPANTTNPRRLPLRDVLDIGGGVGRARV